MSAKSKSALPATPNAKSSPEVPRPRTPRAVVKRSPDSISSLRNGHVSTDRSPASVTTKPRVDKPSPKLTTPQTPGDKRATRMVRPSSELQVELNQAQEDLKKANEKLVFVEQEKAKAAEELNEAKTLCDDANEKLRDALEAQRQAEEGSEIEKFRALELEHVGIEASHMNEEEWRSEIEAVRSQHAADLTALLSADQELQRLKQELAMTCAAKNQALNHADDATKIAEIHAEKVEALSAELVRLKGELDSRGMEATERKRMVSELKLEIDSLREQLEKAKILEEELIEKDAILEQVSVDLEASKMAESYAHNIVGELHVRVEELTFEAEEANRSEKSALESLKSVMKQLEESNDLLHAAKSEILMLKEKVSSMEISSGRQKNDLEESERLLERAKEEAKEMARKLVFLESELETVTNEKIQALNNEKHAEASLQALLEEKNKLANDLETSRDEEEKSKKVLESMASALHEASSEAREVKEKLISVQAEHENYETQIEDLSWVLKSTNEKYETKLGDAKKEIDALTNSVEQSKQDYRNLKAKLEENELQLRNTVKKSEEEKFHMENEISRLVNLLKALEEEATSAREEGDRWRRSCKEADLEVVSLKGFLNEVKAESTTLKEKLNFTENEMQKILQENDDLRKRESASLEKVEELSLLLGESSAKKQDEENGELTDCEKDYDVLPKVVEFSEQNGTGELKSQHPVNEKPASETKNPNGKLKNEEEEKEKDNADSAEDLSMWESYKVDVRDLSPERESEKEAFEDESESRGEGGDLYDQANGVSPLTENPRNGGVSPSKSSSQKKKKKDLLVKFGRLLKKGSKSLN